jgi:hypothetical protein
MVLATMLDDIPASPQRRALSAKAVFARSGDAAGTRFVSSLIERKTDVDHA